MNKLTADLKRSLERSRHFLSVLVDRHNDKERDLTYHAGWDMGYAQAKVTLLEDIIDILEGE